MEVRGGYEANERLIFFSLPFFFQDALKELDGALNRAEDYATVDRGAEATSRDDTQFVRSTDHAQCVVGIVGVDGCLRRRFVHPLPIFFAVFLANGLNFIFGKIGAFFARGAAEAPDRVVGHVTPVHDFSNRKELEMRRSFFLEPGDDVLRATEIFAAIDASLGKEPGIIPVAASVHRDMTDAGTVGADDLVKVHGLLLEGAVFLFLAFSVDSTCTSL